SILGGDVALRRDRRARWRLIFWGLSLETLLPFAAGSKSPLLVSPVCEGLVALAVACALLFLAQTLGAKRAQRAVALGALGALLQAGSLVGADEMPPKVPFDGVLIPYYPHRIPGIAADAPGGKAYLPYSRFRELWDL